MSSGSISGSELIARSGRDTGAGDTRPILVTGGCGFIGSNVAAHLLATGRRVIVLDNLARRGVQQNLDWLRSSFGERAEFVRGDIRDAELVRELVTRASQVFHFAAQVAVTTSLIDPVSDFEINARGTLNVLEAMRALDNPPPLLFTSTNKVYGGLPDVALELTGCRYEPVAKEIRSHGISENRALDFHSPYGCSKGAADQYVIDYARTYGLKAVVLRMSCIYGYRQFGNEDQGWVAHFLIQALKGEPITLYGDGKQVRDILFIDDLVRAMMTAMERIDDITARAFNIGGGSANVVSLLELLAAIGDLHGRTPACSFEAWRPGDQRYYVADARGFEAATGWRAQVSAMDGIERLYRWLVEQGYSMPSAPEQTGAPVLEAAGR